MHSTKKFKIRKVIISDVDALLPLVKQLGHVITQESLVARIGLYQESLHDMAWVGLMQDEIVGYVALHIYDVFHSLERFGRIISLVVNPVYQQQGIGTRLINFAERFALNKHCTHIETIYNQQTTLANVMPFYQKLGYKNQGSNSVYYLHKPIKSN